MSTPVAPSFDCHTAELDGVQLIEASAGTGKTWNLSMLFARVVLESDLGVRGLLVTTFTKAAAAELRERIRRRLRELLAALHGGPRGVDPHLRQLLDDARARSGRSDRDLELRLQLALQEFDQAAIHTLHGFCQRALADVPLIAGVPLEGELLPDDRELAQALMCDLWRRQLARQPLPPALAAQLLARGEGPEQLAALLGRHQAKPLAQVCWPEAVAPDQAQTALAATSQPVLAAWQALRQHWRAERAGIIEQLQGCLPGLSRRSYTERAVVLAVEQWDALLGAAEPWETSAGSDKLRLFTLGEAQPTKEGRKKGFTPPQHPFFATAEDFLEARQQLEQGVQAARAGLMRELIEQALPELEQRKRSARVQTYDDLLTTLYRVLEGPRGQALAASLRSRYPCALVDEFQDTDPLQLAILRRIYGSGQGALFLVGDPKQAIYAFRNADLHSYVAARAEAAQVWTLDQNQRAVPDLIRALNALFGVSPQPFLHPGLRYPPVVSGVRPRPALQGDPEARAALQVWLLPRAADGGPCLLADARALARAACADEIVRLLQASRQGLCLGARPLQASDIAVLVRTNAEGRALRQDLAVRGVGSVELSQASVFASVEAEELRHLLSAMLAPADRGRLLAALATGLLGRDAAAIDEIRQDEGLLAYWTQEFGEALARWQGRGFAAMFWPFQARQNIAERLLTGVDGARRLTNLRHLAELLHAASAEHPAPDALLRWLHTRIADPDSEEERQLRLESDADLVQIVTVHRAKGLEYPVVFCPGLWSRPKPPGRDRLGVREYHRAGSAWIDYRDPDSLPDAEQEEIQDILGQDALAEDLRLVYVALTRAAQRCYLVAGAWRNGNEKNKYKQAAQGALAWLVEPTAPAYASWKDRNAAPGQLEACWQALADRLAAPAALAVAPLPADAGRRWQARPPDPAQLQALPPPPIPARRRVGSYTALVSGRQPEASVMAEDPAREDGARDHDLLALAAAAESEAMGAGVEEGQRTAPAADPMRVSGRDILAFPRGAEAGTCLHAVLEQVDFRRPQDWPPLIEATLARHAALLPGADPGTGRLGAMLQGWLADLAAAPLPTGFRLADLDPLRMRHELEFHLPAPALDGATLRAVLARHGHAAPHFRFEPLHGHLKGFIDLVVEHQGRWYLIDWKSNHLGVRPQDYAAEALQAAVDQHDYALQALLYQLALHRLLRCRLPDYAPERHLGGALYLFVRGLRPGWQDGAGNRCGVWYLPTDLAALRDLSAALDGRLLEPAA